MDYGRLGIQSEGLGIEFTGALRSKTPNFGLKLVVLLKTASVIGTKGQGPKWRVFEI